MIDASPSLAKLDGASVKKGLASQLDVGHSRIEFGSTSVEHGLIQLSLDTGTGKLNLHGVEHDMQEINERLRAAVYATAYAFNAAETEDEQGRQRVVLGALLDAVMARDSVLSRKVRFAVERQRRE
jgi:hypothetical protein